jgi:alpha-galactosidase
MGRVAKLCVKSILLSVCTPLAFSAEIRIDIIKNATSPQVRYISGGSAYVEQLVNGHWVTRDIGASSSRTAHTWSHDAFEIRVATDPKNIARPTVCDTWRFISAAEVPGAHPGQREAVVQLQSTKAPVTVSIKTLLDGTPVVKRWLDIQNNGKSATALMGLSIWSGQIWSGDAPISVGYATKWQVPWEGWFGWKRLESGSTMLTEEHGLTYAHPYFVLHNEAREEYVFGELEWPINRVFEFEKKNALTVDVKMTAHNALRVMAPGENITTPALHMGFIKGDFDAAVQMMHDHIRRTVLYARPADRCYRVECLMPEDQPMTVYRGADYNEGNVKRFLDVASQLGIELFILDGPTWCSNYGEWLSPQKTEFPRGLQPVVRYAHDRHILFGLYGEPEGGRDGYTSINHGLTIGPWKNSQVFKKHADWFFSSDNAKVNFTGSDGYFISSHAVPPVLNLSKPEAAAYFTNELQEIVRHYGLDLYRHDFNSPLIGEGSVTMRNGFLEADYWRQYEALYKAFDLLHANFPELILQQASAGGTRLDLGTLAHFPEDYTSDRVSMPYVYRMLSGISAYLPPETLVTPIGMAATKDLPDLDTMLRSIYALGNTPMVFNSLVPRSADLLTSDVRDKFHHYSDIYKSFIRPALATCRVYHHAPVNASGGVEAGHWFAMEFATPDQSKGWAVVIKLDKSENAYTLKLRGLDVQKQYKVVFDSTGKDEVISGSSLSRTGLAVRPTGPEISELLLFTAK